jgi:hypothetical protein
MARIMLPLESFLVVTQAIGYPQHLQALQIESTSHLSVGLHQTDNLYILILVMSSNMDSDHGCRCEDCYRNMTCDENVMSAATWSLLGKVSLLRSIYAAKRQCD